MNTDKDKKWADKDKEWVLNKVAKYDEFVVSRTTAPSYVRAACELVQEGKLQRKGHRFFPVG